jgi:hypothetical protein
MPGSSSWSLELIHATILHSFAKNAFRVIQKIAKDRLLILPGRDVWVFEILARKARHPSLYDPRISRTVAYRKALLRDAILSWEIIDFERAFVFDTGFAGTIADALRRVIGRIPDLMLSTRRTRLDPETDRLEPLQVFPSHKGARAKALDIEYLPKYFQSGTIVGDKIVQMLAPLGEFLRAAAMTIWWFHAKSPRFIPGVPQPKPPQSQGQGQPQPQPTWQTPSINSGGSVTAGNPANVTFAATDGTITLPISQGSWSSGNAIFHTTAASNDLFISEV